jgi:hypothetical protein
VTDAKKRDSIIKANNAREAAIRAHDDSVAAAERDSARVRTQRLEAARIAAARRDSIVKADLLRQQDSIRRADAAAQQRARDSSRRADSVSRDAARQDSIRKAADAAHQAELSVTTAGQRAAQSAADSFIELLRSKGTNTALALGPDVTSILRGNQGVVTQTRTTPSVDGTLAREVFTVTLRMRIEFGKIANTTYTFRALASRSGDQWGNSRIELVK